MIILAFLLIIIGAITVISTKNRLIQRKNEVENSFGSIDVMLKKRFDLIPNLVETVKVFMNHEKEVLTQLTELRSAAVKPSVSTEEKLELNDKIDMAMRQVIVAVENYPELKSNEQFLFLQRSWNEVEEQISAARRYYNSAITSYNNAIEQFPGSIFAPGMGLTRKNVAEIPQRERENIHAQDLFKS